MYSHHKNVQILLALLKEHGIRNIVASAGTRNIQLVFSAIQDDFFNCYSIVDERSAGFFALGLIQATKEPAVIVCTSGTASCNYLSAVTEAYYQHLPLVVLTSDRLRYHLNQQEDQCIPQLNLYHDVIRKVVDLPIVRDELDEWYCARIVNEALLELDHREKGPVQINYQNDPNYPIVGGDYILNIPTLPKVKKISRIMADSSESDWELLAQKLVGKRIMLLYGQNLPISKIETEEINKFCDKYGVIVIAEHLSNRHLKNSVHLSATLNYADFETLHPDIIITMGGHRMVDPKNKLRKYKNIMEHWHVSSDGIVSDPFYCQTQIIECHQEYFFKRMITYGVQNNNSYINDWMRFENSRLVNRPKIDHFQYSHPYAIKSLFERLPENSLLHLSNSNSIRIASLFDISTSVEIYCNRGTCGIDGSMSTYVAQSFISQKPSFMIIGDLSFFYDMNALWNHYINKNTRIMLINNSGGALLYTHKYKLVNQPGHIVNTPAIHNTSAKGWVESRGFKYFGVYTKNEFNKALDNFVDMNSESPILLEVFTDKDIDNAEIAKISSLYLSDFEQRTSGIKRIVPEPVKNIIKKFIK